MEKNSEVKIENLSFSYNLNEKKLLEKINITVNKGEFIGILGPNGCGKSTLLKLILKYLKNEVGIIKILNKNVNEYTQKELSKILGFVPQKSGISMGITVEELIYMGRVPHIKNKWNGFSEEDKNKVNEIIKMLNLNKFKNRQIFSLSGGEFQRVLLGRVLAQETKIILLDEPTSALDMNYALEMMKLTLEYVKTKKITAIMVLHDLNLASMYCDSIIFLKNGNVMYRGTPKELYRKEIFEEIYGFSCEIVENNGIYYVIPNKI